MYLAESKYIESNTSILRQLEGFYGPKAVNVILHELCGATYKLVQEVSDARFVHPSGGVSEGDHPRSC